MIYKYSGEAKVARFKNMPFLRKKGQPLAHHCGL